MQRNNEFTHQAGLLPLLALAVLGAGRADARFGMVGVSLNQTFRLNVAAAYPPDPCMATIGFRNVNGLIAGPVGDQTVNLQAGQSAFLDFNANLLLTQSGQRIELRPVVTLTPNVGPNACHATAEVFDNVTGANSLALQPTAAADEPLPLPDFGMVGIGLGQVLRVSVVAYPPDPCSAVLGFVDNNGLPVPTGDKTVNLTPGLAAFFDVSAAALGVVFGQLAELRPMVKVIPAQTGTSVCQANAEVFDSSSGRTSAWLPSRPGQ